MIGLLNFKNPTRVARYCLSPLTSLSIWKLPQCLNSVPVYILDSNTTFLQQCHRPGLRLVPLRRHIRALRQFAA